MGLSATLNIAQSALATNAALSSIVSRNIAGVNDPNYSRKTGEVSTTSSGGSALSGVQRATNDALFTNLLGANSASAASAALSNGLDQLEQTVSLTTASATASDTSPATLIGKLGAALQNYAASPADSSLGQAVVTSAKALADNLNAATSTVQGVRTQADQGIATSVATINTLLKQFQDANTTVVAGTVAGGDVTDALDTRNALLKSLSQEIGISTITAPNGSMSIYTDSGVTLFQGTPRTVTFTPTTAYTAGTQGQAVVVDGVPVTGSSAVMPIKSGKLAGLAELRDTTTVAYQNQLDQIAGGLIATFAEQDQTGGGAPTIPGLFTYPGAPAMPAAGQAGLAADISVSAAVDPSQGGTLTLLRDGGINASGNPAYTANTTGAASYPGRINQLLTALDTVGSYNATSGGTAQATLAGYAASSVSWLEASRQSASTQAADRSAVVTQTTTSLSSSTGVNLDDELSRMLDLEHSYHASAELMTTVKSMLDALLTAVTATN